MDNIDTLDAELHMVTMAARDVAKSRPGTGYILVFIEADGGTRVSTNLTPACLAENLRMLPNMETARTEYVRVEPS